MVKKKDFIFTGIQSWDINIGSNIKDIALEVSKENRVLFINTPLDIITYIKDRNKNIYKNKVIKKETSPLRKINDNLWVLDYPFTIYPINFLPDGYWFDKINRINNRKMYQFANKILNDLKFKNYILFIDNDIYRSFYAAEYIKPLISIYYRRDKFTGKFWGKHVPRLEPLLCTKSDLVLTNSNELAKSISFYNKRTYCIGQGVNLEDYNIHNSYSIPSDIERIKRPIIGYTGMIVHFRLNADLIYNIAKERPNCSFVMVGKEDDIFKKHKIHSLKNIHFLGEKKAQVIPSYIASFDICINPQIVNEITIGNYPRKIDEYLALGKPVIATTTNTMDIFKDYVYCCNNETEYLNAIDSVLDKKTSDRTNQGIHFAQSHSWENCVAKIYNYINKFN